MRRPTGLLAACAALTTMGFAADANAFCGFYVSGAEQEMFNDATMVVMMREGTQTVLSMRNTYEGPPGEFAIVVPVPVVLKEEQVKTLKDDLFSKVDTLAAPRLVEYWEQDPCNANLGYGGLGLRGIGRGGGGSGMLLGLNSKNEDLGVKVEAQFDVGEYNVNVLSAKESNGLETWLKQEKYNIPEGSADALAPYIQQGMYFFVAKVDPKKVTFKDGRTTLSPLRFDYDSKDFQLPVRLGLLNAKGAQDLIVHVLSREGRYEVSNKPNVTIPTNLIVEQSTRESYGEFYAALYDRVTEENPGAVVTEYSWDASTCDPCPGPTLTPADLMALGQDVLKPRSVEKNQMGLGMGFRSWTLTRMHARYTKTDLAEDLIFKKAEPIVGGRGMPVGSGALLERGVMGEQRALPSTMNNFQGRYIMLNPWEGEMSCENPIRGRWGGPTGGKKSETATASQDPLVERDAIELSKQVKTLDFLPRRLAEAVGERGGDDGAKAPETKGSSPEAVPKEASGKEPAPEARPTQALCAQANPGAPLDGAPYSAGLLGLLGLFGWRRRRASR